MRPTLVILVAVSPLLVSEASSQTVSPSAGEADSAKVHATSPIYSQPFGGLYYLNWSDLPFTINAGQTLGYNSNVLGLAQGQIPPLGAPRRGDFFSTTSFGLSSKANVGGQQFFGDATYGLTNYRTDVADDTHQYSLDAGVNWNATSRCSGRLVGAINQYQSPIEDQIGGGVNNVNMSSFNETGTCLLTGYISGIFDSGLSSVANSNSVDALNNNKSEFVRGGFEYALAGLDTLRILTTITERQFTNRGADTGLSILGLASATTQLDYQIQYHRVFSPKLTFDGMFGLTQITDTPVLSMRPSGHQAAPVYSVALTFQATPKLSFGVSSSRSVGAPESILANAELTDSQSATMNYQVSPKIAVQTGLAKSSSTGGTESGFDNVSSLNTSGVTAFCRLGYNISPFLSANAGLQYSNLTEQNRNIKDGIITLGLTFRPQ